MKQVTYEQENYSNFIYRNVINFNLHSKNENILYTTYSYLHYFQAVKITYQMFDD